MESENGQLVQIMNRIMERNVPSSGISYNDKKETIFSPQTEMKPPSPKTNQEEKPSNKNLIYCN